MINKKNKFILFIISLIFILSSCSKVSEKDYYRIKEAVEKVNNEKLYKASFVLEVKDKDSDDLIMFVQGSYNIDKSKEKHESIVLNGELVQTVFNTPSSLKFAFYDDTYVTISNEYKILSDLEEEVLLEQFMCSPAISFSMDEIEKITSSEVSGGNMYVVKAKNGLNKYFKDLLGDDVYSFSSMKQPQKDLTEFSDITCKYVISSDGILTNRETSYTICAYDTVPYFPGHQASKEDYKRRFSVSLKFNYKSLGEDISVDISDFLPDETPEEK